MRYLLPFLLFSFIGVFSSLEAEGQALQGGTITMASGAAFNGNTEVRRCSPGNISLSGPSTLASGGDGNYLYYPQYKTATQDWTDYTDGTPVPNTTGYMPPFYATESTQFRRKVVDGTGAIAYSTIMTFTLVQPVLGVISPTNQTIAYNTAPAIITQTTNFDLNGIPIESGQWESSSSATGPWTIIPNANGSLGTYQPPALTESRYYRRTVNVPVTFGCNNLSTNVSTVNVNPCSTSPLVSSGVQMYYDLSQCNYEFTIYSPDPQSSGGTIPYYYLWEKKEPNLTNWSNAPGTNTNATYYRIGNIPSGTKFRRRLTDACGTVVYSNEVTHNFYNPLYAGAIGSNQNIGFGGTPALLTNFSSPENANEINWQVSTNNINWSNINGATGLTYQPPALTQTTYYRRRAVNYTCPDAYTYVVTITVTDLTGGTISTTTPLFCNSGTATFNSDLAASGGSSPLTYTWQSKVGNGNWTDISSANSATYTTPTITQTTRYRRKVTDAVSAVTYSNEIEIAVIDLAGIITSPIAYNGCQSATIRATNLNGATYQWQQLINSNWTDIPSATTNSYVATTNGSYRVFVNLGTCSGYSNPAAINLSASEPGTITNRWVFRGYNGLSDNVNNLVYRGFYEAENSTLNFNTNVHWSESTSPSSANGASPAITSWTGCGVNTDEFTLIAKRQGFDAGTYTFTIGGKNYGRFKVVVNGQTLYNNFSPYTAFIAPTFTNISLNAQSEIELWMMDVINPLFPGSPVNLSVVFTNFTPTPITLTAGSITIPSVSVLCANESFTISSNTAATGGTAPLVYQWQSKMGAGNWTDINGANGIDYTTNLTTASEFRRKATDATNAVVYSNIVALSVYSQTFDPGTITITPLICSASTPTIYVGGTAASGGKLPYSYIWERDNVAVTNPSSNENLAGLFTASNYQGNYSRKATDGCGVTISTTTKMVAVQDIAGGAVSPTNQTIFSGNTPANITNTTNAYHTGTFNPDAGDIAVNITYQWQSATNLNGPWTNIQGATARSYQPGPITQTTYFKRIAREDLCNKTNEDVIATVTVNPLPPNVSPLFGGGITSSNLCVTSGNQPPLITENAASSDGLQPYVFAWEKWTANSGNWEIIPGANAASYQPEAITVTTKFRRKTSDRSNQTAYSNEIIFTVNAAIIAGTISPSSQTIIANLAPTLPFAVTTNFTGGSGNFTYQWQEASNSNGPWSDILGATTDSYLPAASANPFTIYYRLKAIDAGCNGEAFSNIVSLTITTNQTVSNLFGGGIATTATCVILPATPAAIFVSAASSDGVQPYTYEWQMWNTTLGNWTIIPGATNPDLIPTAITIDTKFRRKTIDRMGNIAFSNELSYTVVAATLNGGIIAFNTSFTCAANSINVGLINSQADATGGSTLNYQWQINNGSGWVDIANATTTTYTHGNINVTTSFRRKVSDACGRMAFSNEITANISSTAVIPLKGGLVSGPFITCSNTSLPSGIVDVVNACGNGNLNYQWELWDGNAWVIINGATMSNYLPAPINVTSKYRRKVTDACGNVAYSNEVIIHVYPAIESGAITPMSQELCTNVTPSLLSLATNCHYTPGTVTYQWQVADNSNGPWSDIGGATNNNYQPPTLTENKYYRLKVSSTTCSAVAYTNVAAVIRLTTCRTVAPAITNNQKTVTPEKKASKPLLYPNPLSYQTSFSIQLPAGGPYSIVVRHSSGKIEPITSTNKSGNTAAVSFVRKLPKGTYLVTVMGKQQQWTEKLIVQ